MTSTTFSSSAAALIEHLPLAVSVFGPDGRLCLYNAAFADLWRLDTVWLDGKPELSEMLERLRFLRKLPEQVDFQAFKSGWVSRLGKLDSALTEELYLPDGSALRVVTSPGDDGGLVIAFEDLSPRLAAERAYNESVAVQRVSLDNLEEGIAVFGSDGRLTFHNAALAGLWDLPDDLLSGTTHLSQFLAALAGYFTGVPAWEAQAQENLARYIGRTPGNEQWIRDDGTIVEVRHAPLPDGATLLRFSDVTHRVQTETSLIERADSAEAVSRMKSEFLAHMSRELRVPLQTLSGFAQLLSARYFGDLNKRQQEYADGITETVFKLNGMISDIVDLAEIEAGLAELASETVDLHHLVVSVLSVAEDRLRRKKLEMNLFCASDIGTITADGKRLRQVLLHLLYNAIEFTPPGGQITFTLVREEDGVVLSIADTGIGIAKKDHDRIFRSFEQVVQADCEPTGVGLGLTLVKTVIESHGGPITLKSSRGRGTTVNCFLPGG
jgi:signal transduction histidine kinase